MINARKTMDVKRIIAATDFRFNKRYGQNFITDDKLLGEIVEVAGVGENDIVVEIGVGAGTLTRALAGKVKTVYGYEIDKNLQPVLAATLSGVDNAEVIFRDFMREDMAAMEKMIGERYVVVANLPYYITSPIVMRLMEEAKNVARIVVMVQEEVADRLCAEAGTPDYGAITLAVDVIANAKKALLVDRKNFFPAPNVDSAVVRIDIDENKYDLISRKAFRDLVRCAFSSRRKTFANNLINTFSMSRAEAEELLLSEGISPTARGETLSTGQFVALANKMTKNGALK